MHRFIGYALLGFVLPAAPALAADEGRELFNGKDLSGWIAEGVKDFKDGNEVKPVWTAADQLLTCAGHGYGFLRYDKEQFADFALHLEYRMAPKCNSGIGIRTVPFDPARSGETTTLSTTRPAPHRARRARKADPAA